MHLGLGHFPEQIKIGKDRRWLVVIAYLIFFADAADIVSRDFCHMEKFYTWGNFKCVHFPEQIKISKDRCWLVVIGAKDVSPVLPATFTHTCYLWHFPEQIKIVKDRRWLAGDRSKRCISCSSCYLHLHWDRHNQLYMTQPQPQPQPQKVKQETESILSVGSCYPKQSWGRVRKRPFSSLFLKPSLKDYKKGPFLTLFYYWTFCPQRLVPVLKAGWKLNTHYKGGGWSWNAF